ncbi:MAG: hypothetical protein WAV90_10400 [Gordonia amarae]
MISHNAPNRRHGDVRRVVALGDRSTLARLDLLENQAAQHGSIVVESYAFDPGEARNRDRLHEVAAVVDALRRAIEIPADIWVPFPVEDLTREQHMRRLGLVLERHGLDLLLGRQLSRCPERGLNAVDYALRAEVRAVDALDRAALAASGARILAEEIEIALAETVEHEPEVATDRPESPDRPPQLEAQYGPLPSVPGPDAPWEQRVEPLKALAVRLTASGMTQAKAADIIHSLGHRPPAGGAFTQVTVSMLLRGRYDRDRGTV